MLTININAAPEAPLSQIDLAPCLLKNGMTTNGSREVMVYEKLQQYLPPEEELDQPKAPALNKEWVKTFDNLVKEAFKLGYPMDDGQITQACGHLVSRIINEGDDNTKKLLQIITPSLVQAGWLTKHNIKGLESTSTEFREPNFKPVVNLLVASTLETGAIILGGNPQAAERRQLERAVVALYQVAKGYSSDREDLNPLVRMHNRIARVAPPAELTKAEIKETIAMYTGDAAPQKVDFAMVHAVARLTGLSYGTLSKQLGKSPMGKVASKIADREEAAARGRKGKELNKNHPQPVQLVEQILKATTHDERATAARKLVGCFVDTIVTIVDDPNDKEQKSEKVSYRGLPATNFVSAMAPHLTPQQTWLVVRSLQDAYGPSFREARYSTSAALPVGEWLDHYPTGQLLKAHLIKKSYDDWQDSRLQQDIEKIGSYLTAQKFERDQEKKFIPAPPKCSEFEVLQPQLQSSIIKHLKRGKYHIITTPSGKPHEALILERNRSWRGVPPGLSLPQLTDRLVQRGGSGTEPTEWEICYDLMSSMLGYQKTADHPIRAQRVYKVEVGSGLLDYLNLLASNFVDQKIKLTIANQLVEHLNKDLRLKNGTSTQKNSHATPLSQGEVLRAVRAVRRAGLDSKTPEVRQLYRALSDFVVEYLESMRKLQQPGSTSRSAAQLVGYALNPDSNANLADTARRLVELAVNAEEDNGKGRKPCNDTIKALARMLACLIRDQLPTNQREGRGFYRREPVFSAADLTQADHNLINRFIERFGPELLGIEIRGVPAIDMIRLAVLKAREDGRPSHVAKVSKGPLDIYLNLH